MPAEAVVTQLAAIHDGLAQVELLPAWHIVDAGYARSRNVVASRAEYQIDLVGPTYEDRQWQAHAKQGFDLTRFQVDWARQAVTCPQGRSSARWSETRTASGHTMVTVAFAPADCTPCAVRAQCTRAKALPRSLTLQPKAEHEAIHAARQRQVTAEFAAEYARRAGVEGTLSEGVRAHGLRHARYRGLRKTHLQHVATAAAMNLGRLDNWLTGVPRAATRRSRFDALTLAA